MKKLLFGITSLTLGGAERVLVDVSNRLVKNYDVTIFTIYAKGELEKELDSRIHLISLYNFRYGYSIIIDSMDGYIENDIMLKLIFDSNGSVKIDNMNMNNIILHLLRIHI